MELTPSVLELARTTVAEIVEEHFPRERQVVDVLWRWWLANQDSVANGSTKAGVGLPAVGASSEEFYSGVLMFVITAVLGELPPDKERPSQEDLARAVRAAGSQLGLTGTRLEKVAGVTTPRLWTALGRVERPALAPPSLRPLTEPLSSAWVETWTKGRGIGPKEMSASETSALQEATDVDLIVDELSGYFVVAGKKTAFTEHERPRRLGVWLALVCSGKHFDRQHVEEAFGHAHLHVDIPKQCAAAGRAALTDLVGHEIIQRGKASKYYVDGDWSWIWIRRSRDRLTSALRT